MKRRKKKSEIGKMEKDSVGKKIQKKQGEERKTKNWKTKRRNVDIIRKTMSETQNENEEIVRERLWRDRGTEEERE